MKNIMAGNCPPCAACAIDCLNLYSGYHTECSDTFPSHSDEWSQCHEEVLELNSLCIDDCFQVN